MGLSGRNATTLRGIANTYLAVLLVGLVACAALEAAQAESLGRPIKIGILTDLGSVHSINTGQGSVLAAHLAIDDAGGSVNGVPIELVTGDHRNKPDVAVEIARRWYQAEGVDVIVDVPNSDVALAVQRVAREQNKIVMFSSPAVSDITGIACTPVSIHWTYDTYALAHVTAAPLVTAGFKSWFFITADYSFGHTLERETAAVVTANHGTVAGSVRFPSNNSDFSPFLLQALQSNAQVLALSSAGTDTPAALRQASAFGILQSEKKFVIFLIADEDISLIGLDIAQGLLLTTAFYWDINDQTREFGNRFFAERHSMPNMYEAGVAGAITHYLKAVRAVGHTETNAVMAKMRELPVNDFMTHNGRVREDGRVIRDLYLFQVKTPSDSKGPWDTYRLIRVVPGEQAFRPLADGNCPLVKH